MMLPSIPQANDSLAQRTVTPLLAAQESPLGGQLFFLLSQMEYEFRTKMHVVLDGIGLDVRQYSTLAFIADGHTPTQHNLAKILHLDPSQVVKLTKGLADRELLVRETLPQDRRAKALVITDKGKRLYKRAALQIREIEETLTASLSRRDKNVLKILLDRILPAS